jgi:hypothetical protein
VFGLMAIRKGWNKEILGKSSAANAIGIVITGQMVAAWLSGCRCTMAEKEFLT